MKKKCLSLLLVLILMATKVFSQPTIISQIVTGGSLKDSLTVMYLTADGGSIAGGSSSSNISGEKTANCKGGKDYWVVKFSSLGSIQWDKTIGGDNDDVLTSLQQTADRGYILGGYSVSKMSGDKTQTGWEKSDYWVVKLDYAGNIQWDKTIGGNRTDCLKSILQTSDGGYLLGGYSNSGISGLKTESTIDQSYDYWIVKLNSNGAVQWDKTIGGSAFDGLISLDETGDAGFILAGYSESPVSGQKTEPKRGLFDYWIVKINSAGTFQWDKTIGGDKKDQLASLLITGDGGYFLAGYSYSDISGEKSESNRGRGRTKDYWVVKLDSLRNIQWDKTIGGDSDDSCLSAIQTTDGGYLLGGYSQSGKSGDKTENSNGVSDYWIVKLTGSGTIEWDKTLGGSGIDNLTSIKEISANKYVLAGYSNSGISGDKTISSRGSLDYWILNLLYTKPAVINADASEAQWCTHTVLSGSHAGFTVYPNPANTTVYIQVNSKATFFLINQAGKLLLIKNIDYSGTINVANLASGLYYLKNNTTGAVQKIIVSR